ncbi:MAG: tyrosine-type recombinase/integrase [Candidatus Zixiibacteriota bacterium]
MENFIQRLECDELSKKSGGPYSDETKVGIKKSIKKFWKWKDGDNRAYPSLVEWIDTYIRLKDVPALTRSEVENMIDRTANPRNKAIIMVLFDSGARIEELLNVRLKKEHLFWKEELGCYMIRLEYSKTKPRTISLPLSTKLLKSWLEAHPGRDSPGVQLFPLSYPNLRMILQRLGRKALEKRVTPHMLRHSSATYYANRLKNPYKLCYRYGWTMASNMVNRYIDREGILEEETPGIVKTDEISSANRENRTLKEELSLVKESHSELGEQFQELKEELSALESGKGVMTLLLRLAEQQKQMSEFLEKVSGKKFDIVLPHKVPRTGVGNSERNEANTHYLSACKSTNGSS